MIDLKKAVGFVLGLSYAQDAIFLWILWYTVAETAGAQEKSKATYSITDHYSTEAKDIQATILIQIINRAHYKESILFQGALQVSLK